jgi:hypothetical protein
LGVEFRKEGKRMYMKTKFKMLCVFIFGILAFSIPASANTLYVDDDGSVEFTSIQEAIDNAVEGDTIYVYNGTYK